MKNKEDSVLETARKLEAEQQRIQAEQQALAHEKEEQERRAYEAY